MVQLKDTNTDNDAPIGNQAADVAKRLAEACGINYRTGRDSLCQTIRDIIGRTNSTADLNAQREVDHGAGWRRFQREIYGPMQNGNQTVKRETKRTRTPRKLGDYDYGQKVRGKDEFI